MRKTALEVIDEMRAVMVRYPAFVRKDLDTLAAGDVPVFTFHTIEPGLFESQLAHLSRNGYRTIDCAALHDHMTGRIPAPQASIMLTIDDGRKSVWTYAHPLLRRYGMQATVFLIPGYVEEEGEPGPNLEDVEAGRCAADALSIEDPRLMNWAEIDAMARSGTAEFQSHTLFHHQVPIADRLDGFVHPGTGTAPFDLPVPAGMEAAIAAGDRRALLGLPIFAHAPLMTVPTRYHPDPALVGSCLDLVRAEGGPSFFERPDWQDRLRSKVAEAMASGRCGRLDEPGETRKAVREDLARSRREIEDRLGRPCRFLCYPYAGGSSEAVEISRAVGFLGNFWGTLQGRTGNRAGDDPMFICRVKNDFVHRLPGEGRRSLASIMTDKVQRRLRGLPVY